MSTFDETLARLRAIAAAQRAEVWEKGRPRQRAADKRRRLAKAEDAYRAMPKLLEGAERPIGAGAGKGRSTDGKQAAEARRGGKVTRPGEWTPNPPGGKLGGRSSRGQKPLGLPPFVNPRPATPAPGRMPFDTLFTDVRHLRGDLRMVRTAIREDRVPMGTRKLLIEKLCRLLDTHEARVATQGGNRAARILIAAAQCLVDGTGVDQREEFREYRQERGFGARGPMPHKPRTS